MKLRIFIIIVILIGIGSSPSFGQEDTTSAIVFKKYQELNNLEDRYDYIDSIDYNKKFPTDSLFASLLSKTIDEKLRHGDTSEVLGMSISLMNYFYNPPAEPNSSIQLYHRLQSYLDNVDTPHKGGVLLCIGDAYYAKSELQNSYDYYKKATATYRVVGDSSFQNYGRAYLNAADVATNLGNYGKATQDYRAANSLFRLQKDTSFLLWTYQGQSQIYNRLRMLDKAKTINNEIERIAKKSNSYPSIVGVYASKTSIALKQKNYNMAVKHARQMVQLTGKHSMHQYYRLYSLLKLSYTFLKNDQLDSAQHYFTIFENNKEDFKGNQFYLTDYNILKARLAYANGKIKQTQAILNESLSPLNKIESTNNKTRILNLKYAIDTTQGQYKNAISHLLKSNELKDSIQKKTIKGQFSYYQTLFESAHKKREIATQEAQIAKLELKNRKQRNLWIAIVGGVLFLAVIGYFIREYLFARRERELQEEYSQSLLAAQEEERRRISRELHDGVGQSLILIKNKVKLEKDDDTEELVKKTLEEVRQVSRGLHPFVLENLGLTAAIKQLVQEADNTHDIFFDLNQENVDDLLSDEEALNVYRIIQEALSNLLKHSGTDVAKITVQKQKNNIYFRVQDLGMGFDLTKQENIFTSLGMKTMKERTKIANGKISITSEKDSGTTIELTIPH